MRTLGLSVMLLCILAGCGGAEPESPAPIATATPSPTPTATATSTPIADLAPNFELVERNNVSISQIEQAMVVAAGTGNVINGVDPIDSRYLARNAAATTPAADPRTFDNGSGFLSTAGYLGAINPANPRAFEWGCVNSADNPCGPVAATAVQSTVCPPGTQRFSSALTNPLQCALVNVDQDTTIRVIPGIAYYGNTNIRVGVDVGTNGGAANGKPVTLTLEAGVNVTGFQPQATFPTPLISVNRGSRIVVNGTATAPVRLTSVGLVIAGRAPTNRCRANTSQANGTCENSALLTPAIPLGAERFSPAYGGTDGTDTSGRISYLEVEMPYGLDGAPSLALFGVGNGSVFDNVRITGGSGTQLGLLIVGGAVNLSRVMVQNISNEAIYIAEGWRGQLQYVLGIQGANVSTFYVAFPRLLRIDEENGRDDALPRTRGVIANFTFVQVPSGRAAPVLIGNGVDATFVNGIIKTPGRCIAMAASTAANGGKSTIRPAGGTNGVPTNIDEAGPLQFTSNYLACLGR